MTMLTPLYQRLPMGCSHSVHILMSINLRIIGQTLVGLYRPCHDWAQPVTKPMSLAEVKRTERCAVEPTPRWTARDRRMGSPLAFLERARRLKADSAQAVVVLHAFAGARRVGDIEERMIHWATIMNVVLLIESDDMAFNA